MIEPIIVYALCAWLLYRYFTTKKKFNLYIAIFVFLFQLSKWPVFIPFPLSLALIAFFAAGLQMHDFYYNKAKTKNVNLLIYAGVSFFLGIVFIMNFLIGSH